ncbi:phenylacetaldoxime dehydratase [Rhodococcus rhodnii LMG 5362]|uniref:Phenylacetaldoxime dehydratase n=1 Tax=Rhodococcus rhodnii LMG 5362 TaxID=1273125 RepID=R7WHI8_9NOCA|nr:phenylacetaldoxime dehydratase [Rhodococcus rhodnii LMG 5362]
MTSDYLAVQCSVPDSAGAQQFLSLVAADRGDSPWAPEAWELLSFIDDAGFYNLVHLAYWKDSTAHARWLAEDPLPRWFAGLDAESIDFGAWHEVIQVPTDRVETVYSDPRRPFGLAACAGTEMMSMTTNGYFGAARDRMPVTAIDRLEPAGPLTARENPVDTRRMRVRAECGHNTTVIRSGQYWQGAEGEQRSDYEDALQPKLMAGMRYLADNPTETGTLSLRVMTSLDPDTLEPLRETSVLGHFHDFESLETWSASHPTHLAIYRHAIEKNREYGDARTVVTWHEVFALPRSTGFEYVNCHPRTGILPYAIDVMAVL